MSAKKVSRYSFFFFFLSCGLFLQAQENLIQQLFSREAKLQQDALNTLIALSPEEQKKLVLPLTEAILHSDKFIRSRAKIALKFIGIDAKAGVPLLIKGLSNQDKEIRLDALFVLMLLGSEAKEAFPALRECLKDPVYNVRFQTLLVLGNLEKEAASAVPDLITLYSKENWIIKKTILGVLGEIWSDRGAFLSFVRKALKDENQEVCFAAIEQLSKLGPVAFEAVPELRVALEKDRLRIIALKALGRIGSKAKETLPKLIELLTKSRKEEQILILETLGRIGESKSEVIPVLLPLLTAEGSRLRLQTAKTLVRLNLASEKAFPILIQALNFERNAASRGKGNGSGGGKGDGSGGGRGKGQRSRAAYFECLDTILILGELGPQAKEASLVLNKFLMSEDLLLSLSAAVALGQINGAANHLLPSLIKVLQLRRGALRIKGKHSQQHGSGGGSGRGRGDGSGGGSGGQKKMIKDLCIQSIHLIVELDSQDAIVIEELMLLMNDKDKKVRNLADWAFIQITKPR